MVVVNPCPSALPVPHLPSRTAMPTSLCHHQHPHANANANTNANANANTNTSAYLQLVPGADREGAAMLANDGRWAVFSVLHFHQHTSAAVVPA